MKPLGVSRTSLLFLALLAAVVAFVALSALKRATASQLSVEFEGPWAFVPDPQNAGNILAIAPNTKSHRPLAVGNSTLEAGVYELAFPGRSARAQVSLGEGFYRTRVDPKNVQRAQLAKRRSSSESELFPSRRARPALSSPRRFAFQFASLDLR